MHHAITVGDLLLIVGIPAVLLAICIGFLWVFAQMMSDQ